MKTVRATTPTRIDLAGGTLDLWPIHHQLERKATVNVGVTLTAQVDVSLSSDGRYHLISDDQELRVSGTFGEMIATPKLPLLGLLLSAFWRAELPPLSIRTQAKSPAGAGLGGSSCLGVAVGAAIRHMHGLHEELPLLREEALIQTVQDVESRLIKAPTGIQDYWGGMRGRLNILRFPFGGVEVETLAPSLLPELGRELIVCFSGKSRASAINNWEIFKRIFDGDQDLIAKFNQIGALADDCGEAMKQRDLRRLLALSQAEWRLRTQLWPNIETPDTKRLDAAARAAGAEFSRVCGAGGGGVMAVFAPPERQAQVRKALTAAGGSLLDATIAETGLTVEVIS